jgi:tetratricopeptide (TPR) repeat protein
VLTTLSSLAEVKMALGHTAEAIRACEEAYGYAAQGVSPDQGSMMLIQLGRARAMAGDSAGGRADIERGIAAAERIAELADAGQGRVWLSEIARHEGDFAQARVLLDQTLEQLEPRRKRVDFGTAYASASSKRGCLAEQEGDLVAAARWHETAIRGLDRIVAMPINRIVGTVVLGFAALAAARGEHVRAAELLGGAHTLQGELDPWSLEVERATAAARDALGREAFDEAYDRGHRFSREEILALLP